MPKRIKGKLRIIHELTLCGVATVRLEMGTREPEATRETGGISVNEDME